MGADILRGTKRMRRLLSNYVVRRRADEGGSGDAPLFDGKEDAAKPGESPRALLDVIRLAGDKASNAGGPWRNAENNTPQSGGRYLDHTPRRPKALDMEDDWRSNGILHGRKVAPGLDDRPEVGNSGRRRGFARRLQSITQEMNDTLSSQHARWGDGARTVALGVYLMSQVRMLYVDSVHLLNLDVGASLQFIRDGGLSYYTRGRFREIWSSAPVKVASQCAQYAQTSRATLPFIGDNGMVVLQNRLYTIAPSVRTPRLGGLAQLRRSTLPRFPEDGQRAAI